MALGFDAKEDLHLRMADLEKKLTESEEERCKLEKTCNVLMRAFKEEEKMRYKALNKKYEKFLEDCTVRKRRNDIILRTLGRIEDRSKVLFAKTERLKLLKDRYISQLKLNEKNEGFKTWNGSAAQTPKITEVVPAKLIQWKTTTPAYQVRETSSAGGLLSRMGSPLAQPTTPTYQVRETSSIGLLSRTASPLAQPPAPTYQVRETPSVGLLSRTASPLAQPSTPTYQVRETPSVGGLLSRIGSPLAIPLEVTKTDKTEGSDRDEGNMADRNGFGKSPRGEDPPGIHRDNLNFSETNLIAHENVLNAFSQKARIDESGSWQTRAENCVSEIFNNTKDGSVEGEIKKRDDIGHQESFEILKKMAGNGYPDNENNCDEGHDSIDVLEKDRIEQNEKNPPKKSFDELIPLLNHSLSVSSPEKLVSEEEKHEADTEKKEDNEEESAPLPKGLDGVDYENETYPESYYEQPTHHNHASIASDVILEEDETEQEEADNLGGSWVQSSDLKTFNETDKSSEKRKQTDDPIKDRIGRVGGRESGSEKSTEEGKTDRSDKVGLEKPNKSSLIQLLDSDTESFQIEHGDAVSGNDDSEFDFSFGQN